MLYEMNVATLLLSILPTTRPKPYLKQAIGCVTYVLWWGVGWKSNQEPAFQPPFPITSLKYHIFALKLDVQNVTCGSDGRKMVWSVAFRS